MAIDKGNIKTSANYDVKAQKPLDGRAVRPTKADLINKESWSYDGNTVYVYEGMQVYVEDEKKTYYLKDISKLTAADYSGWELMGTGAGQEIAVIDNLNSTDTTAALSANQGRVIADELAGKQDLLMNGINIKTINGENIMGRGNIVIESGGGGIAEEVEVYIGEEEPTEDGAKLWVDTDEEDEPSSPSQPSGNGRIYFLPMGIVEAIHNGDGYVFTEAEAKEYRDMIALFDTTMIVARGYADRQVPNGSLRQLVTSPALYAELSDDGGLDIMLSDDSLLVSYMDNGNFFIGEENGQVIAHA